MLFKSVVAGSFFLMAVNAFAYPTVGDRVEYMGTATADSGSIAVLLTKEIMRRDEKSTGWIVKTTQEKGGVSDVDEGLAQDIFDAAKLAEIMNGCVAGGGRLETVVVPAGEFASCHKLQASDGGTAEVWYADVPFGIVKKIDTQSAEMLTLELNKFDLGKE